MNEHTPPAKNIPFIPLTVGAILIVGAAVALVKMNRPPSNTPLPGPTPDREASLTSDEASALIRTAQLANGRLENIELSKADALYSEIIEQLPNESLGVRNQAICRYLLFEIGRAHV